MTTATGFHRPYYKEKADHKMTQTQPLVSTAIITASSREEANRKAQEFANWISYPCPENNVVSATLIPCLCMEQDETHKRYCTSFRGEITLEVQPTVSQDRRNWERIVQTSAARRGIEITHMN